MKFSVLLAFFQLALVSVNGQLVLPGNFLANWAANTPALFLKPVTNFSVSIKENNKPFLRWQSSSVNKENFFSIERSHNGTDYEVIGVIKNIITEDGFLEFTDDAPFRGKIYYRVKFTSDKQVFFSEAFFTSISEDIYCKFYPNPVDKMLIVRSDLPVDIQINDAWGKSFILTKLEAGLRILDVSALPTGVYVITLQQKDSNKLVTERLVKK
jgi:hypothetical protein